MSSHVGQSAREVEPLAPPLGDFSAAVGHFRMRREERKQEAKKLVQLPLREIVQSPATDPRVFKWLAEQQDADTALKGYVNDRGNVFDLFFQLSLPDMVDRDKGSSGQLVSIRTPLGLPPLPVDFFSVQELDCATPGAIRELLASCDQGLPSENLVKEKMSPLQNSPQRKRFCSQELINSSPFFNPEKSSPVWSRKEGMDES